MPTLADHLASQVCPICDAPFDAEGLFTCSPHPLIPVLCATEERARELVSSATVGGVRVVPGHMLPAFEALARALAYRADKHDEQRRRIT